MRNRQITVSNECLPAYKHRSVFWIEFLYLYICWSSCGGINQPQRHIYCPEDCTWTHFALGIHLWYYFCCQNPTKHRFKLVFTCIQTQVCLLNRGSISLHMLNDLWLYQSTPETPISPIILYLNPFCVKDPFLVLLLLSEAEKAPFQTSVYLHTTHRYIWWIEVLSLSICWRSCGGLNQTYRHLYYQ